MGRSRTAAEHEIVKALIEAKAVDFEKIGGVIAKFGASAALSEGGEDWFCGTMRRFIIINRISDPLGPVENLGSLRQIGAELER